MARYADKKSCGPYGPLALGAVVSADRGCQQITSK